MQLLQELKSIFRLSRKRRKHIKILSLAKINLSTINMVICKALIKSYINNDELVLVNNVVR